MAVADRGFGFNALIEENKYQFMMLHFTYDNVTQDFDYIMTKSFNRVYSASMELVISYPMRVVLS